MEGPVQIQSSDAFAGALSMLDTIDRRLIAAKPLWVRRTERNQMAINVLRAFRKAEAYPAKRFENPQGLMFWPPTIWTTGSRIREPEQRSFYLRPVALIMGVI